MLRLYVGLVMGKKMKIYFNMIIISKKLELNNQLGKCGGLVCLTSKLNSFNKNDMFFNEEKNAVFPNAKTMCCRRQINKWFGKDERILQLSIIKKFFGNSLLDMTVKLSNVVLSSRSKQYLKHQEIFKEPKDTQPFSFASLIAALREEIKSSLIGIFDSISSISHPAGLDFFEWYSRTGSLSTNASSISESKSNKACVLNTNNCGHPALSKATAAFDVLDSFNDLNGLNFDKDERFKDKDFEVVDTFISSPRLSSYFKDSIFNMKMSRLNTLPVVETGFIPSQYINSSMLNWHKNS